MNENVLLFIFGTCIIFLTLVIFLQKRAYNTKIKRNLEELQNQLYDLYCSDMEGRIKVFTEDETFARLSGQINQILDSYQRMERDYEYSRTAYQKMLSNISHDIKTPMTVILGYLEIMRQRYEDQDGMLEKTEKKTKEVMNLINEFFTLAKLEAGDYAMETGTIDVGECLRRSILSFYEILEGQGFQVEIKIPKEAVWIDGDPKALNRIFENLISNGIEYGGLGKYLGIFLETEAAFVKVSIIDRGPGIDKKYEDKIFERLFTMEDSRNKEFHGTGLGLTIARNLARQMKGEIMVKSHPWEATIFTVRFPRKKFVRFIQQF